MTPPGADSKSPKGSGGLVREERETKTAAIPRDWPDWPLFFRDPIGKANA
jgi:hypothetical protein